MQVYLSLFQAKDGMYLILALGFLNEWGTKNTKTINN